MSANPQSPPHFAEGVLLFYPSLICVIQNNFKPMREAGLGNENLSQPGLQVTEFLGKLLGQPITESLEVFLSAGDFLLPKILVHGQNLKQIGILHVQAFAIQVLGFWNEADRSVLGLCPTLTALDNPLQDTHIFAVSGPNGLAVVVHAEPVDAEDFW